MNSKPPWKPWHQVVQLRDDLKTGELSLAVFAADLYDVIMQKGARPMYEDAAQFFVLTYPTYNLRELVKDVMKRLAGKNDKAIRQLQLTYGGGKTHTLITLRHLVDEPEHLPNLPAVHEFEAHFSFKPPKARVVALCFDKFDVEKGIETRAPNGCVRVLKAPWSVIAHQIAGDEGLRVIHADGKAEERETPPAEPLLVELLSRPQKDGLSTLVLIDEVLMYAREKVGLDPVWRGRLLDFFQYLTQAAVKVDRCALVASLLASDPSKSDAFGKELIGQIYEIFGRQREEAVQPVQKEDVAEVLRRRFFKPGSIRDINAFRPHVTPVVNSITELDEQTKKDRKNVEERFLASYPFHPDLTEILYAKWMEIDAFQKTRGVLRLFAIALRDASMWDTAPMVGPNVFLSAPGDGRLSEAMRELASIAMSDIVEGRSQPWINILPGELEKACAIQCERPGLKHHELEQAVCAVFLHSQPIGKKALTRDLMVLLGATRPDKIELEKGLKRWADISWFLDEVEVGTSEARSDSSKGLPKAWRLGNRPNLRQMHFDACNTRVPPELIETKLLGEIEKLKSLTMGATAAGARVHLLPGKPRDIEDDGEFHYGILEPKTVSDSGKPSPEAKRFIDETTAADRPRVYRNAIVLAVPSKDGLEAARTRIRDYLGWEEVKAQLKDQPIDPIREEMLNVSLTGLRKAIPDAIRQAYCIVVTVNETNEVQAFKITVGSELLFNTIKADKRARIQDTAISSEAMLPGGPYDLWREGETSRRVKDLVGAFAQFPKLPKMLRVKEILDTVLNLT
jgi:Predicted ATPase (AAA+ superfamily)